MDLRLTDKRALVSGSTKGIGLAIGTALAREGALIEIEAVAAIPVRGAIEASPTRAVSLENRGGLVALESSKKSNPD